MKLRLPAWFGPIRRKVSRLPEGARLPIALGTAVCLALLLTIVSVVMYNLNGTSKLDLSRPGFEHERQEISPAEQQKIYDITSPVTYRSIKDFLQEYDTRNHDLSMFGNFSDQALQEEDLQLQ